MVSSKRGRMSSADREHILALAKSGLTSKEIATTVARRLSVVEAILDSGSQGLNITARRSSTARMNGKAAGKSARGLLEHQIWIRPGYHLQLALPADLTASEAERLANWARSLPFA